MFVNDRRNKLEIYFDKGGKVPQKDDVVVVYGSKKDDILFIESLSIMQKKCYMKLSDIK